MKIPPSTRSLNDGVLVMKTSRIATLGLLAALAVLFGYIETLVPFFFGIPGIKIGLANMAIITVLYLFGAGSAAAVSLVRILVVGLLFGNLYSILYSFAGAACSLAVMVLLKKTGRFGIAGISAAGGVAHNMAQLAVAALVVQTYSIAYYLPVLIASGVFFGIVIGIAGALITKRLGGVLKHDRIS